MQEVDKQISETRREIELELLRLNHPISEQLHFRTITTTEVQAVLMSISSSKSAGQDKIPIKVYKDCLSSILPSITDPINTPLP